MSYRSQVLPSLAGGTGVANSNTITLGGAISTTNSFTTSGNFPLTLTQTASTNVTLPTSGTLATTSQLPSITATQYDVLVGGAANAIGSVGPGSAGQVLQSSGNAANPAYSTATYPSTTTANQLLYSSATNTVSGLATANNAVLGTDGSGVPSITTAPRVTSITFDGTNLLSSYVESTFTPTLLFGGSATGFVYSTQSGTYKRIGNVVFFYINCTCTTKGSGTGNFTLSGLPVTSANLTQKLNCITATDNWTWPAGQEQVILQINASATTASFITLDNAGVPVACATTNCTFTNSMIVQMSGFYFV